MLSKGTGTSFATKVPNMVASAQANPQLFLDELEVDGTGTIIVMVSKVWDVNAITSRYLSTDFVVSDSKRKIAHVGMCAIMLTSVSAKTYNNKLYLSSTSSTSIYDNDDIPLLQELKAMKSCVEPNKEVLVVESSQAREGTVKNLLLWARNRKNDAVTFHCKVMSEDIRTKSGWNYPSCSGEKCRKSVSRELGKFLCKTCNRTVDYPVLRYGSQDLFQLRSDIDTNLPLQDADDGSGLPTAIRNLIVADGASSSNQTLTSNDPVPSFKRLTRQPSVCTPSKPNEEKRKNRSEVEDSDADEGSSPAKESDEFNVDGPLDKKKKKRYIEEDS
ncbi:DNA helicase PIF1, ATP-dependent [Tanacetum coccineum]